MNRICCPENGRWGRKSASATGVVPKAVGSLSGRRAVGALSGAEICFVMEGRTSGAGLYSEKFQGADQAD